MVVLGGLGRFLMSEVPLYCNDLSRGVSYSVEYEGSVTPMFLGGRDVNDTT